MMPDIAASQSNLLAQQYLRLMNQFAEQFGLTPAASSWIIAGNNEGSGPADDMDTGKSPLPIGERCGYRLKSGCDGI